MSIASSQKTSSGSNNTRDGPCKNIFMLTVQNSLLDKLDEIYNYCSKRAGFTYGIVCSHNKGHNEQTLPHVHVVLQYHNPIRLSIKKLCGAHIDTLKYGSIQKMVAYAKGETGHDDIEGFKAEVLWEDGEMRRNGGMRTTAREIQEMTKEEILDLPCQLHNIATKIIDKHQAEQTFFTMLDEIRNDNLKQPEVVYITGDSGKGKTYKAFSDSVKDYKNEEIGTVSIENNFFSFINPEAKCLVVPEFRPSQCRASLLLEFIDKYGFNAPIKGGFQYIRPERIYICSIIHPEDLYSDEKNKQFIRRITSLVELN